MQSDKKTLIGGLLQGLEIQSREIIIETGDSINQ